MWTAALFDAEQGYPYLKRFSLEASTRHQNFLGERTMAPTTTAEAAQAGASCLLLLTETLNHTIESVLDYEQDATKIMAAIRKTCSSKNNIFRINHIFSEELYQNYPDLFEKHTAKYKKEHIKYLREFLSRAAADGYVKPNVDVDFAAGFMVEIFDHIIFDRLHVEGFDRGDTMKNFWAIIFGGIMMDSFWQKCDDDKNKET